MVSQSISHYRVIKKLGAGGMGEVYLAEDTRLDRKVALKLLPIEFTQDVGRVRRFMQEAKAASALNHPNIITVYDIGESEAGHFIAMELVVGRTLRAVIAEDNTPETLLTLGHQITKALSAAHDAGITHRDIKPDNIMVRDDGYVKILDFGLARLVPAGLGEEAATLAQQTQPGQLMGTIKYMSPEQARGEAVSQPSDIFSLGLIFYELATGRHPFTAASLVGLLNAIIADTPAAPSHFNPQLSFELERLVLQMLNKEACERPTAAEVNACIEAARRGAATGTQGEALHQSPRLPLSTSPRRHTVGRERERHELHAAFNTASGGRGSLLCVAGEPGIGKTTLVEDFLDELAADRQSTIARGRCSERLAGTGAYLPLLEALESLLQSDLRIAATMRQLAPTWYAQVVSLSDESGESARLLAEVKAASQERMKRELANFLQATAQTGPLVIFFDDLHWADVSTIDLLSFLAGKFDTMRVLIVTTYRPSDMLLAKHPFLQIKPDLQARGLCRELQLEFLTEAEIAEYLTLEFPDNRFPAEFPQLIHAKTEGSPLFMADLVRYLRDRGAIAQTSGAWALANTLPDIERELPESVRGMIERKIAQLGEDDRKLLTAASVQGYEFDSAVVARVLEIDAADVEESLEALERVHAFVRLMEEREFPDRTLTQRYRFIHVLYQNALYAQLRPTRRVQLSGAVARALEGYWGEQSAGVANELAVLHEAAREFGLSAKYFHIAAQNASQLFASQEAVQLARRGLAMVETLPEGRERNERELSLQVVLGNTLIATIGYSAPEVEQTYSRARELCQQLGETPHWLPVLCGLCVNLYVRGKYRKGLKLAEEFLALTERWQDPAIVVAHRMVGNALLFMGELTEARYHYERIVAIYTPAQHRVLTRLYAAEPGMNGHMLLAVTLWLLGYPDVALRHSQEALRLGREVSHANSQGYALYCAGMLHQFRGESQPVHELAESLIALATEQGLAMWLGAGMTRRGWMMVQQGRSSEGIEEMRRGIDAAQSVRAQLYRPFNLCLLAEAWGKAGRPAEGLAVLADVQALIEESEERYWEAELHRLRGELLLMQGAPLSEVEQCFHRAIEIARRQQAKSLELRAAMSLSRLWRQQGKRAEARDMLAEIYGWFTEGFDTADLREAKALLDELS